MPSLSRLAAAVAVVALVLPAPVMAESLLPEGVPDRGPVLSEPIRRGEVVLAERATRTPRPKVVDGDPRDWIGTASRIGGATVWDAGEHIYSDFLFDAYGADDGGDAQRLADFANLFYAESRAERIDQVARTSGSQLGVPEPIGAPDEYGDVDGGLDVADLHDVRWAVAPTSNTLHLLARVTNLTEASRLGVLVLADTKPDGAPRAVGFGTDLQTVRFDRAVLLGAGGPQARDLTTDTAVPTGGKVAVDAGGWTNALEASLPAAGLTAGGVLDAAVIAGRIEDDGSFTPLNAAYRHAEPVEIYSDRLQALSLLDGDVDAFASGPIALADLRAGRTETAVHPGPGYHELHMDSLPAMSREGGRDGVLQPYGVYVPSGFVWGEATPTTFWLHYRGGKAHSGTVINPRLTTQLGEERGNLVVFPHARGTSEWYVTESHQDFFEVYADVHERFPDIDRARTYVSGYSMGGYGSWLLATLYPDLFAAAFVQSGAITQGAWVGGGPDDEPDPTFDQGWIEANDGDARAQLTYRALENLRHVPFAIDHGTDDELVPITGIERMAARLTELGYDHRMTRLVGYEHFSQAIVDEWADGAAYLDRFRNDPNPRDVTYAVVPSLVWSVNNIDPAQGAQFDFRPDGAYWVDDIVVRDVPLADTETGKPANGAKGVVDLVSEAIAAPLQVSVPDAGAASPPGHSTPFVRTGLQSVDVPDAAGLAPAVANRFSGTLTNVASATADTRRMDLDFTGEDGEWSFGFSVTVDGPTRLRLTDALAGRSQLKLFTGVVEGLEADGDDAIVVFDEAGEYTFSAGTSGTGGAATLTGPQGTRTVTR